MKKDKMLASFFSLVLMVSAVEIQVSEQGEPTASRIVVDWEADAALAHFGRIIFVDPSLPSDLEALKLLTQPVSVGLTVELSAAGDFSDWLLCYTVDNGAGRPQCCMAILVEDGSLRFAPHENRTPPIYDDLNPSEAHMVVAWFASKSSGGAKKWGLTTCPFAVAPPLPKHANGEPKYLGSDEGEDEFEINHILLDGALVTLPNPSSHLLKATPTVCGALVEPEMGASDGRILRAVAHSIGTIMEHLPMVRPIHLFHGPRFLPCGPSNYSGGGDGRDDGGAAAAHASLCRLVSSEAVVPHALTRDDFAEADRNRFLKSRVFWARLAGSDKVLMFGGGSVACGGEGRGQGPEGRPRLVRDLASSLDFVGHSGGGVSLRSVSLARDCAERFGALTGDEPEGSFFERCVAAQGGRVASEGQSRALCTWGSDGGGGNASFTMSLDLRGNQPPAAYCPEFSRLLRIFS